MVNACPTQSDPRPNVGRFITDPNTRALAGLVVEGLESLMEVVEKEIRKQEPDSNIVRIDRDVLSDENICFDRELESFIDRKISEGKKVNLLIIGDVPVIGWNNLMEKYRGSDMQVYFGNQACRQVPLCTKLF